jgi:hypothetical protein
LFIAGLAIALLLPASPLAAQTRETGEGLASGVVFHDRDRNGIRDRFEFGIRNVAVSNGRDVVLTDWRGRYQLSVTEDTIVFVVKPGGWATPLDERQIPRFHYIHKPAGSPQDLAFPGVAPTGPLPDQVDFPLYRRREPRAFSAILFGDTQPYTLEQLDLLGHDVAEELIGTEASFGISLGDLVGDDLSLLDPLNGMLSRIGIPWYNVIGNHDLNFRADSDQHSDETFERIYGPPSYAFSYGRVHFIVLDNVVYGGASGEERAPGSYAGGLSKRQLEFVENYLANVPKDRLVVLAMHIPFDSPPYSVPEHPELLELLADRPHTLSLAAHMHFQESQFFGSHHHLIHATTSGSWWLGGEDEVGIPHATMRCGAPNGYSIIRFDGQRYSIRFKAARRAADHQMNIFAPESITSEEAPETEVVVNVFAGSERTQVELRLGDAGWTPLRREAREDPYYLQAIERDLVRVPRPPFFLPPAIPSPHLWVGTLPENLPPGVHALEVRATDMYGQTFRSHRFIRIERATPAD